MDNRLALADLGAVLLPATFLPESVMAGRFASMSIVRRPRQTRVSASTDGVELMQRKVKEATLEAGKREPSTPRDTHSLTDNVPFLWPTGDYR